MYGLHGIFSIKICSDHISIFLIQHSSSYHHQAIRGFFPQLADCLFHTYNRRCHQGTQAN